MAKNGVGIIQKLLFFFTLRTVFAFFFNHLTITKLARISKHKKNCFSVSVVIKKINLGFINK